MHSDGVSVAVPVWKLDCDLVTVDILVGDQWTNEPYSDPHY